MSSRIEELTAQGNPFFNRRKLKLGTFSTNNSGGCAISTVDGVLEATWENSLDLARLADEMQFEALVPVGRWKGFGGVTDFNGASLEVYTWAAAVAASTQHCGIFATSHVFSAHPLLAAKQGATVDVISRGRFGLNVVTGYYQPEVEMFGKTMMAHDERYAQAEEWLHVVKRLWTERNEFDHEGKYFRIKQGYLNPKPTTHPYPVVMCAGVSDAGRHFAARFCDVSFVPADSHDFEKLRTRVRSYKELARQEYRREIAVWTNAYVVQGDTEEDAKAFHRYYADDNADWVAAANVVNSLIANTKDLPPDVLRNMMRDFISGWGGFPLVGTKEQIVSKLERLSEAGFDGILLSWPRYQQDMLRFKEETYPLIEAAGLR